MGSSDSTAKKVVSLPQPSITSNVDDPLLHRKHWPVCASHIYVSSMCLSTSLFIDEESHQTDLCYLHVDTMLPDTHVLKVTFMLVG